jgi:hypothetical protein
LPFAAINVHLAAICRKLPDFGRNFGGLGGKMLHCTDIKIDIKYA